MQGNMKRIQPAVYQFNFSNDGSAHRQSKQNVTTLTRDQFYLNDQKISDSFWRLADPILADWLDIAMAVYVADRRAPRRDRHSAHYYWQWARVFNLRIPVRKPDVWQQPSVVNALCDLLRFFTDDTWVLEFTEPCKSACLSSQQDFLLPIQSASPVRVALYSGGLDSFAGAVTQVTESPATSFVFVSGTTNSRQQAAQQQQVEAIRSIARGEVHHVVVPFGFRWRKLPSRLEENSQRTRGFMFHTIGAVTALLIDCSELYLYENGIGAINLPYDATQVGTACSRAVHPLSLLRMGEFVEILTGRTFRFINPFLYMTKGEMCSHSAVRQMAEHIGSTFSCDGFPVRASNKPQCGTCTSCLLRRMSVGTAGLSEFDRADRYLTDLLADETPGSPRLLKRLRVMEWQYYKIRDLLRSSTPWADLVSEYPQLQTIVSELCAKESTSSDIVRQSLIRLYTEYINEWQSFPARRLLPAHMKAA